MSDLMKYQFPIDHNITINQNSLFRSHYFP